MSSPNILIYRLGSLGDMIVALPCFHQIRKTYPHSKIIILTNEPVSGKAAPAMAILEHSGLCDGVIHYPIGTRSLRELAKVRRRIRDLRPGLVINLAAGRGWLKSVRDLCFFWACGVRHIIGTPFRQRDLQVQPVAAGRYESEAQRLASRLAALGEINLAEPDLWKLGLTSAERKQAEQLLPAIPPSLIAVSVGTKLLAKDWGEENWRRVLSLLTKEMPEATLVLLGAPDEWDRSEQLSRVWSGPVVNLCGKTSPRVSAAVLEHCQLFIGHDSGPLHLAAAVGVPCVGIFSWNNPPGQWFPGHSSWDFIKILYPPLPPGGWSPSLRLKRSPTEGVLLIQPDTVLNAAMELWRLKQAASRER